MSPLAFIARLKLTFPLYLHLVGFWSAVDDDGAPHPPHEHHAHSNRTGFVESKLGVRQVVLGWRCRVRGDGRIYLERGLCGFSGRDWIGVHAYVSLFTASLPIRRLLIRSAG